VELPVLTAQIAAENHTSACHLLMADTGS
jgi:hypothetical protein